MEGKQLAAHTALLVLAEEPGGVVSSPSQACTLLPMGRAGQARKGACLSPVPSPPKGSCSPAARNWGEKSREKRKKITKGQPHVV